MIAYILAAEDLAIKDILEFDKYEFVEDSEYADKSTITVPKLPNVAVDDFCECRAADGTHLFAGIVTEYSTGSEMTEYTITLAQMPNLFDHTVFFGTTAQFQQSIETYVQTEILGKWANSGDQLLDKPYISVRKLTNTACAATPSSVSASDDGETYNFKTFLGNLLTLYGIHLSFEFHVNSEDVYDDEDSPILTDSGQRIKVKGVTDSNRVLYIEVENRTAAAVPIDVTMSDIASYSEEYDVNVLAKLSVLWKQPDTEDEDGYVIAGERTNKTYYLKSDRSITENISDPLRVYGDSKSIVIEAETEAEMRETAAQEFASNEYKHKVGFSIIRNSLVYPESLFYLSRKLQFKTKSGIKTSIITGITKSSESALIGIRLGTLKVTLIEKLRGKYR